MQQPHSPLPHKIENIPPLARDPTMPPCIANEGPGIEAYDKSVKLEPGVATAKASSRTSDPKESKKLSRSYTVDEVSKHDKPDDAWIIYRNQVLDVTKWVSHHPGGEQTLLRFAGMDATDELRAFHDDWVLDSKLPHFVIGSVKDPAETTELLEDFRKLGETFETLGYYRLNPYFYVMKLAWVFSIFGCVLALIFGSDSVWAHRFASVLLGFFWQQLAFVGHDCGHMSARTHARDSINVDLLAALVVFFHGVSVAWWKATHNVHHAVPNTLDCDPDIAHLPVFAVDKRMFSSLYNMYHKRVMKFDWIARNVFVPYQHFWYYPIMCVARFNLYIQTFVFIISSNDGHAGRSVMDVTALMGFFTWLAWLVSHIPGWNERIIFFFLSHAVAGLLNVQITLSHFSQPVFASPTEVTSPESKYGGDFFTRNVISSLDVECPTYMDWFHGGLQFQTLHHLYPRIARHHLRKTEPAIASLCKKHSLPYSKKTFWECNVEVFETLKTTAQSAQKWSPLIYESMCAQG